MPSSPLIGSVSHEVNSYGSRLIHLGLAMINGDRIPPYNYVDHKLITAESLATVPA
jgi:ribose transport system substrate-binding protein